MNTARAGKLADIIVADRTPLFDVVALSHLVTVVHDGVSPATGRVRSQRVVNAGG